MININVLSRIIINFRSCLSCFKRMRHFVHILVRYIFSTIKLFRDDLSHWFHQIVQTSLRYQIASWFTFLVLNSRDHSSFQSHFHELENHLMFIERMCDFISRVDIESQVLLFVFTLILVALSLETIDMIVFKDWISSILFIHDCNRWWSEKRKDWAELTMLWLEQIRRVYKLNSDQNSW